ncbi:recombinase family protein [uncultured Gimesia sp.]|uniref:recombinase family protein n=1 Tax=uncultured Gimesia sp. TaxID=1678688 RepID=UPI0034545BD4
MTNKGASRSAGTLCHTLNFVVSGKTVSPTSQVQRSKNIRPSELRDVYAEVVAKVAELRDQGKTHMEVCKALNDLGLTTRTGKLWRHPQQIVKLLRSFEG